VAAKNLIVPSVPLVAAVNSALMTPDVGLAVHKLVYVELQGLRVTGISNPEIHVIGEVVQ
jgi:hypothetical protein